MREQVRHKRGRNRDEGCFADTYKGVPDQQFGISMRNRREQGEAAPENGAQHDDEFARIPVGKRPHERRGNHVEGEECAGQIPDLGIGHVKFVLHQGLHRKQHVAIHVVQ